MRAATVGAFIACVVGAFLVLSGCASVLEYDAVRSVHPPLRPWPDSRFVVAGGTNVHLRVGEPTVAPTTAAQSNAGAQAVLQTGGAATPVFRGNVLLLHGLAGSTWSWHAVTPALNAHGYRTVALDIPPFGFSDNRFAAFGDPAAAAVLMLEILTGIDPGPWTVIGHSMGARYAVEMAAAAPRVVDRLILIAGAVGAGETTGSENAGGGVALTGLFGALVQGYVRDTLSRPERLRPLLRSAYATEPSDAAVFAYAAPFAQPGKIDALLDWAQRPGGAAAAADLSRLTQPVALIWGRHDTWVPLQRAAAVVQLLPSTDLTIIEAAGHNPMETHPDPTIAAVLRALDRPVSAQGTRRAR